MNFKIISILFLCILFPIKYAFTGGHTGNGGGSVYCPGQRPVVLEYFTAKASEKKLIDIESMQRDDFFALIIKRLKLGCEKKVGLLGTKYIGGSDAFNYHDILEERFKTKPQIMLWPEINKWRVRDEFIENALPIECHYEQSAITSYVDQGYVSYRVKGQVEALSKGQQHLIELHELLQELNWNGTNISVRELVGVLIQKKINYKEIRLALMQFSYPGDDFSWKFGDIKNVSFTPEIEYDPRGLFALDLRNIIATEKTRYEDCPHWIGITIAPRGNKIPQLFIDSATPSENLFMPWKDMELTREKYIVKHKPHSYELINGKTSFTLFESPSGLIFKNKERSCPYIQIKQGSPFVQSARSALLKENKLFPFYWNPTYYVQKIRTYYEQKNLELGSEYEKEMNQIRSTLNW